MEKSNSIGRNILNNASANIFGQVVTIGIQLLSLPIYLKIWSVSEYGHWLILTAIPFYMSMADVGVVGAAANRMALYSAASKDKFADRIFSAALYLCKHLFFGIFLLGIIVAIALNHFDWITTETLFVIVLLMGVSLGNIFPSLSEAVCRASGANAVGVYLTNIARITEWVGLLVGLIIGKSYIFVALGMLIGRVIGNALIFGYVSVTYRKFKWSTTGARRRIVHSLVKPSLAFAAFPVGNLVGLQGMSFLVGVLIGPTAAALFATHRTISRILVQALTVISHSVWPEFTKLYAINDTNRLKKLYFRTIWIGLLITCLGGLSISGLGTDILRFWSHGQISADQKLLNILLAAAIVSSLWLPGRVLMMATGKHIRFSVLYLLGNVLSLLIFTFLAGISGVDSAGISILLSEIFLLIVSHRFVKKIIH